MTAFIKRRQSYLIAICLAAGLVGWMLSGIPSKGIAREKPVEEASQIRDERFGVRVQALEARPVRRHIVVSGRTEPARSVTLRSEVEGRVTEVEAGRGNSVQLGDVIARIDARNLHARLTQAKARVEQRALQFEASKKLNNRNFQSETALAEARANLEAARAEVTRVQIAIDNSTIRAPFDGVLHERWVEVGDYLADGDEVARVLEQDPILVTGQVTQHEIGDLRVGASGTARLITGESVQGRIRYVAPESDADTRTFRFELEVANPHALLVAGVTAEVVIPTSSVPAHHVSPAVLSLSKQDQIGVKTVGAGNVVEFHPVEIVRAEADGFWVSGLPGAARVITVGHGFVGAGDTVRPVSVETQSAHATNPTAASHSSRP